MADTITWEALTEAVEIMKREAVEHRDWPATWAEAINCVERIPVEDSDNG